MNTGQLYALSVIGTRGARLNIFQNQSLLSLIERFELIEIACVELEMHASDDAANACLQLLRIQGYVHILKSYCCANPAKDSATAVLEKS